jgi:hypothetical protein
MVRVVNQSDICPRNWWQNEINPLCSLAFRWLKNHWVCFHGVCLQMTIAFSHAEQGVTFAFWVSRDHSAFALLTYNHLSTHTSWNDLHQQFNQPRHQALKAGANPSLRTLWEGRCDMSTLTSKHQLSPWPGITCKHTNTRTIFYLEDLVSLNINPLVLP